MGFFDTAPGKHSDEAKRLVSSLRNITNHILDESESYAWAEHEASRLTDDQFFIVIRRLRLLSGLT
jgi:hypothetical protein